MVNNVVRVCAGNTETNVIWTLLIHGNPLWPLATASSPSPLFWLTHSAFPPLYHFRCTEEKEASWGVGSSTVVGKEGGCYANICYRDSKERKRSKKEVAVLAALADGGMRMEWTSMIAKKYGFLYLFLFTGPRSRASLLWPWKKTMSILVEHDNNKKGWQTQKKRIKNKQHNQTKSLVFYQLLSF